MKKIFIFILLFFFFSGCTKVLTNTSKPFLDVQSGLLENTTALNNVAKKVDVMADLQKDISLKLGLGVEKYDAQKSVANDTKELLAIINSNNEQAKKDREASAEVLNGIMSALKIVAPIAGQAIGIPAPITSAGLSLTDALLGAGGVGAVAKIGLDMLARRRKDKEHEQELREVEDEKEGIKASLLIKERTAGKMPSDNMQLYKDKRIEAIAELKAEGKI